MVHFRRDRKLLPKLLAETSMTVILHAYNWTANRFVLTKQVANILPEEKHLLALVTSRILRP
jgi:hypothetical protein